jgi:hypothetical protein
LSSCLVSTAFMFCPMDRTQMATLLAVVTQRQQYTWGLKHLCPGRTRLSECARILY